MALADQDSAKEARLRQELTGYRCSGSAVMAITGNLEFHCRATSLSPAFFGMFPAGFFNPTLEFTVKVFKEIRQEWHRYYRPNTDSTGVVCMEL